MEILKCNADYNKVYYVEINGSLRQCKLIRTESSRIPVYVLDVAQTGVIKIKADRFNHFDKWYHKSEIPSILYESIEDYRNGKPITDEYGSTGNCYNSGFINKLFKHHTHCNCGGYTYTWKWDGCKAIRHIVNMNKVQWSWDAEGFHCELNDMPDCYRTGEECIKNNEVMVVKF
jgi:hypothetical protein